jgi:uncharacterized cupredoxin-like copper-binding protein
MPARVAKQAKSAMSWAMTKLLPALLLCATALPVHAADKWSHPIPLTVVMVDNRFQPDHVVFRAGKTYALRLENHGKDLHEFTAPAFFKAAQVRDKRQLANSGAEVVVQPHESATILLIAPPKGAYPLTCADHDWDGMVGQISVE